MGVSVEKKQLTQEEIYKRNQKKSKVLRMLAPIVFWGFLALSIICLILTIKNSFGNVAEIINMLDTKKYTGEELQANYQFLVEKYGEWVIGNGGAGNLLAAAIKAGFDPTKVYGIEIDEEILKIAQSRLVPLGVPCTNIHLGDALNPCSYNF